MPFYLLLAMQAAGSIVDYMGVKSQAEFGAMGAQLQQLGIESNIEQTRLESEDASLQAMIKLRQNLGTQMAVFAARGTRIGAGNSVLSMESSVQNFNADERMRRMNLLSRETALKGQGLVSQLNQEGLNTQMWQSFLKRTAERFPTSPKGMEAWTNALK